MSTPDRQRIFWLDAAKAYGMFLLYYGQPSNASTMAKTRPPC